MRALAGPVMAALTCAGCALPTELISESYVGDPYYGRLSCPELATAQANVQRELGLASREQSRFVGVVFPSGEYAQNTAKIAELKGTLAAIERARSTAGCGAAAAGNAGEAAAASAEAGPQDIPAPAAVDGAAAEPDYMPAGAAEP